MKEQEDLDVEGRKRNTNIRDTNILYADKNLKTLEATVNAELKNFCDWLRSNKLSLNTKKSNFVLFHPYQKRASYHPNISIFDNEKNRFANLESKDYIKYLGVLIGKHFLGNFILILLPPKSVKLSA